ncbi:ABC transporter permease [Thorsellia kenyensis]|uniref:ABC transporter permease n=1 Tax=Thorsellia kenyensis TaxID=1549888 RepID=A0ABV6CAL0_9GAMM
MKKIKTFLLLLPGLGAILLLMGGTFYIVIAQSLGFFNLAGENQFSFNHWINMLSDTVFHRSLFYSIKVSLLGALGSIIFSYPLAIWLRRPMKYKEVIIGTLRAPMFVPGLVAAFLFVNIIAYHGIINELLVFIGIIDRPIRMQNDEFGWAVIILQIWKNLPFALILVSGSVNSIRGDVLDAASNLGATRWNIFKYVIFPMTLSAVQAAFILIFIGALGDFAFSAIAGPRSTYSLARLMQTTAMEYDNWNGSAVIAVTIMLITAIVSVLISVIFTPLSTKKGAIK